jgi:lambda family phage portal protein
MSPEAPRLKLLESDFIVSYKDQPPYIQGIKVDENQRPVSYLLYKKHPGDTQNTNLDFFEVPASRVIHAFKQDRPGQMRGVPWSHAVIETLKDFADFQNATLIARKISACFVGLITSNGGDSVLDAVSLKAKREAELQMNPGTFKYLSPGEDVKFSSPPGVEGYSEFTREQMRATAAGYGISYERFTGDYSQVNFSSGRMGDHEFRRNVDAWRWHMLIPQFCEPYFNMFLEYAAMNGIDTKDAYVEWVPPAHTMIDPVKEVAADKEAVLAGFKSRSQVIRESGYDPEVVRDEIKLERDADDKAQLTFDTNFESVSANKAAQGTSNNENQNKADAAEQSDSSNG